MAVLDCFNKSFHWSSWETRNPQELYPRQKSLHPFMCNFICANLSWRYSRGMSSCSDVTVARDPARIGVIIYLFFIFIFLLGSYSHPLVDTDVKRINYLEPFIHLVGVIFDDHVKATSMKCLSRVSCSFEGQSHVPAKLRPLQDARSNHRRQFCAGLWGIVKGSAETEGQSTPAISWTEHAHFCEYQVARPHLRWWSSGYKQLDLLGTTTYPPQHPLTPGGDERLPRNNTRPPFVNRLSSCQQQQSQLLVHHVNLIIITCSPCAVIKLQTWITCKHLFIIYTLNGFCCACLW